MNIVSTSTMRWVPGTMLPLVVRQLFQEYLQLARIAASACLAIAIGCVCVSYGVASLGFDTLKDVAVELVGSE